MRLGADITDPGVQVGEGADYNIPGTQWSTVRYSSCHLRCVYEGGEGELNSHVPLHANNLDQSAGISLNGQ